MVKPYQGAQRFSMANRQLGSYITSVVPRLFRDYLGLASISVTQPRKDGPSKQDHRDGNEWQEERKENRNPSTSRELTHQQDEHKDNGRTAAPAHQHQKDG